VPNKQDATGHDKFALHKRNKISGAFGSRLIEMLKSPSYRVMSLSAHRVLSRIEIEHAAHGGKDNGKLPVTFEHFVEYRMDRHAVAPAIRELVALGFIEVTERGRSGEGDGRSPNKFRLTYRHSDGVQGDGTHEWRRIKTLDEAERIAAEARDATRKPRNPVLEKRNSPVGENALKASLAVGKNALTPVGVSTTTAGGFFPTTSIPPSGAGCVSTLPLADLAPPDPGLRLAA
jgi:hypothetical protein